MRASRTPSSPRAQLAVVSDDSALLAAVDEALAAQPDVAEKIRGGKVAAAGAIVGAVMKATRGQADAARVRELVARALRTGFDRPAPRGLSGEGRRLRRTDQIQPSQEQIASPVGRNRLVAGTSRSSNALAVSRRGNHSRATPRSSCRRCSAWIAMHNRCSTNATSDIEPNHAHRHRHRTPDRVQLVLTGVDQASASWRWTPSSRRGRADRRGGFAAPRAGGRPRRGRVGHQRQRVDAAPAGQ